MANAMGRKRERMVVLQDPKKNRRNEDYRKAHEGRDISIMTQIWAYWTKQHLIYNQETADGET